MGLNRIKSLIVFKGSTAPKVAEATGISRTSMYDKLSGRTHFTVEEAKRISEFLGLSSQEMQWAFFEED